MFAARDFRGWRAPLGTIATEREVAAVFEAAGFSSFRRAAESFTNRVFEARV